MNRILQLPEGIYQALEAAAQAEGVTPADWLASHLPQRTKGNGHGAAQTGESDLDAWLEECIVDAPRAVGSNNQQIDADLARAYAGQARTPPTDRGA
jgi:hypothetical protein